MDQTCQLCGQPEDKKHSIDLSNHPRRGSILMCANCRREEFQAEQNREAQESYYKKLIDGVKAYSKSMI